MATASDSGAAEAAAPPPGAGPTWSKAGASTAPPRRQPPPSLLDTVQSLLKEIPGLFSDRVELLSLELKRAAGALAQIVVFIVAAAILGVTAWLALWVGITLALVALGLHWLAALAIVLAVNVVAVLIAVSRAKSLVKLVALPATRRSLTIRPSSR